MPDENPTPLCDYNAMERETVYLLTDPEHYPTIWSIADIGRQLETMDPMAIVRPLQGAGLVHVTSDRHVFATQAAHKMIGLVGQVI